MVTKISSLQSELEATMTRYRGRIRTAEDLGRILQQGRMVAGRSQRQEADDLGISQRYVWDLESGKPSLVMERLFAMLRHNGVELYAELDDGADEEAERG
jgi:HTH-type transcriptional regulator/antitoxin HipB